RTAQKLTELKAERRHKRQKRISQRVLERHDDSRQSFRTRCSHVILRKLANQRRSYQAREERNAVERQCERGQNEVSPAAYSRRRKNGELDAKDQDQYD